MAQNNSITFSFALKFTDIPYYLIAFVGTTSNLLLLIAFIKDPLKCFRNSGTYLVMTLSVADLYTCSLDIPLYLQTIVLTPLESVFRVLNLTFVTVSFESLASIAIDRFLLVAYPLKHHHLIRGKVMVLWLSGIWLTSAILPISGLFYDGENELQLASFCFSIGFVLLSAVMYAFTYIL